MKVNKKELKRIIQEEYQKVLADYISEAAPSGADPVEIIGSLINQHGFLNVREPLEQMGFKVDFVTSPMAMYLLEKDGVKFAALNKKYAEDPGLVVGDIAIGRMD